MSRVETFARRPSVGELRLRHVLGSVRCQILLCQFCNGSRLSIAAWTVSSFEAEASLGLSSFADLRQLELGRRVLLREVDVLRRLAIELVNLPRVRYILLLQDLLLGYNVLVNCHLLHLNLRQKRVVRPRLEALPELNILRQAAIAQLGLVLLQLH